MTGNTAGDGTTTATVLAHVIHREGAKLVAAGYHPLALKRGIDAGVARVVEALAKMSRRVTGKRDIAKVATVSANGDAAIGKLIGEAVGQVGLDGSFTSSGRRARDQAGGRRGAEVACATRPRTSSPTWSGWSRGSTARTSSCARTRSAPSPNWSRSWRRSRRRGGRCYWSPRSSATRSRCWSSTSCRGR